MCGARGKRDKRRIVFRADEVERLGFSDLAQSPREAGGGSCREKQDIDEIMAIDHMKSRLQGGGVNAGQLGIKRQRSEDRVRSGVGMI